MLLVLVPVECGWRFRFGFTIDSRCTVYVSILFMGVLLMDPHGFVCKESHIIYIYRDNKESIIFVVLACPFLKGHSNILVIQLDFL